MVKYFIHNFFYFLKNSFFNIQHNLTRQFGLQLDWALDEQAGREKSNQTLSDKDIQCLAEPYGRDEEAN